MENKMWGDTERISMEQFKKDIHNDVKPDKKFSSVEEGLKWMKEIRK